MQRVALEAIVGARTLAEEGIATLGRALVVVGNCRFQRVGIDAGGSGEFRQRCAPLEIAIADIVSDRHRKRWHAAEPVFA